VVAEKFISIRNKPRKHQWRQRGEGVLLDRCMEFWSSDVVIMRCPFSSGCCLAGEVINERDGASDHGHGFACYVYYR